MLEPWPLTTWAGSAFYAIHVVLAVLLLPQLLLQRKEPQATIAWLFAILFVPVLGSLLYLAFGSERLARRAARQRRRTREARDSLPAIVSNLASPTDQIAQVQLFKLLDKIDRYPPVKDNSVKILSDMYANFREQLEAIDAATDHVHLEYYIFRPDPIGERFSKAMLAAAARGVEVRFLYDAVGGMMITSAFLKRLEQGGVKVARHIPMNLFSRRWIFNFRNHRKILVVDGKIGFMGGANIGEEYLGRSSVGQWLDLHLRIEGSAVAHLQRVFADDWAFASGTALKGTRYYPPHQHRGDIVAQVVPGGPDLDQATFHELTFAAITGAVEKVRIMTPYFVPTEPMRVALETAGRRGVDIKIMVPAISTKAIVKFASRSYYGELLDAGVNIYEYMPGFLHSKMLTIDGRWALVGTPNFDARSWKLNFEVALAIYDAGLTKELDQLFDDKLKDCLAIERKEWKKLQGIPIRIVQNLARLFSPIL